MRKHRWVHLVDEALPTVVDSSAAGSALCSFEGAATGITLSTLRRSACTASGAADMADGSHTAKAVKAWGTVEAGDGVAACGVGRDFAEEEAPTSRDVQQPISNDSVDEPCCGCCCWRSCLRCCPGRAVNRATVVCCDQ